MCILFLVRMGCTLNCMSVRELHTDSYVAVYFRDNDHIV